jgi:hypothetical protein
MAAALLSLASIWIAARLPSVARQTTSEHDLSHDASHHRKHTVIEAWVNNLLGNDTYVDTFHLGISVRGQQGPIDEFAPSKPVTRSSLRSSGPIAYPAQDQRGNLRRHRVRRDFA